jgi:hypothetical protein
VDPRGQAGTGHAAGGATGGAPPAWTADQQLFMDAVERVVEKAVARAVAPVNEALDALVKQAVLQHMHK